MSDVQDITSLTYRFPFNMRQSQTNQDFICWANHHIMWTGLNNNTVASPEGPSANQPSTTKPLETQQPNPQMWTTQPPKTLPPEIQSLKAQPSTAKPWKPQSPNPQPSTAQQPPQRAPKNIHSKSGFAWSKVSKKHVLYFYKKYAFFQKMLLISITTSLFG